MTLRRVLLVDDCIDNHELIREALAGEYEVYGLADPLRFQDALKVAEPDLIILDLLMPKKSGFEILEEFNRMKGKSDHLPLPVIVLSAKRSVENHKRAYALGAVLYLNKPFEPDRLLRNIKMLMDNTKLPPLKPKSYKIGEIDHQLELRSSFKSSTFIHEDEARKAGMSAQTAGKQAPLSGEKKSDDDEEDDGPTQPVWVD